MIVMVDTESVTCSASMQSILISEIDSPWITTVSYVHKK